jgi:hypothetical protein
MIKLKTLLDESFGGMLAAAIRANNAITPHKNKFKVDPKQVKVGDELEWYGKDKDPRVTGTISKIDSKGIEITNLKAVGTKKMDYGLKGVTINANTKYFYFGSYNKMLNHWKLKDSQDTDQNNNGYPDSTEGSTNNEFTALLSSLESDLKAYDGEEITYEDDDETMEITVSIYPSELKKEIVQAINVILKKHTLFKIDKDTIDRYRDEDGVTLTFDIIKK